MPQAPRGVAGRWRPEPSACALPPQLSFQRKVGILYCRAGQGSEEEMYNNQEAGPAFMIKYFSTPQSPAEPAGVPWCSLPGALVSIIPSL